jgi:hypothetical protein
MAELEKRAQDEGRDEAGYEQVQEEQPFERVYPGTTAKKNVTVRRSRDRLSGRPVGIPRTPEDLLSRRSLERPEDKRSEEKGQHLTQGASAVVHVRKHGEELRGPYRVVPYSQADPDAGFRYAGGTGRPPPPDQDDHRRPYLSGRPVAQEPVLQWPWGGSKSPSVNGEDEDDHLERKQEEDVSDNEDEPLFLRRDIPSISDAPEVHEQLTQLWELRQKASVHLVEALDKDDSKLFEKLESTMRSMNQAMHHVMRDYRDGGNNDRDQVKYIDIDDLPGSPTGLQSSQKPVVTPPIKPIEERGQMIQIILDYEGNQVYRTILEGASNLHLHHLAVEYLMEVFDSQATQFADYLLFCHGQEIPIRGSIAEFPIGYGAIVEIAFRHKEDRTPDPRTPRRIEPSCPGGSSRGYHQEESHSLTSARASSRPGNNGEAAPGGSPQGYQRGESHSLTSARAPSRPGNNGGAIYNVPHDDRSVATMQATVSSIPRSMDKIKQAFKCPRFSGQQKDWKQWNKGFIRYLSIWDMEHVIDPDFVTCGYPLPPNKQQDNKMVYLILEDAVQSAPMASSYVRQAPAMNGFEAYYTLHDGYVFAGATTSTLLLAELSNFRFLPSETPTALVLRLEELFQELELLPVNAAVSFIDTQKIGYLLNALRHEEEWDVVSSYITSAQIRGQITFREACEELKVRCETARAHELLDRPVKGRKVQTHLAQPKDAESPVAEEWTEQVKTFISTVSKRLNLTSGDADLSGSKRGRKRGVPKECLADGCDEKSPFALCGVHYHSLVSAKIPSLKLRNGYGEATYNVSTHFIDYPPRTPTDRLPSNASRKVKAGAAEVKA